MKLPKYIVLIGIFQIALSVSAQERQKLEQAILYAAPPSHKIRTTGHEWVWELEKAGVINRSAPRRYRVALPLMTIGESGPKLMATYASPAGFSNDRKWMVFVNIPLE